MCDPDQEHGKSYEVRLKTKGDLKYITIGFFAYRGCSVKYYSSKHAIFL